MQNKKFTRRTALVALPGRDGCDCPACSGADVDPAKLIDDMVVAGAELAGAEDPLEAEIAGAVFVALGTPIGAAFQETLVGGLIPAFEATAATGALAMLLAIGSVQPGRAGRAAMAAADRLAGPGWPGRDGRPTSVSR